jgi:hypothetical protein
MELPVGDRFVDETREWEVIGRPYTSAAGKNAHVCVRLVERNRARDFRKFARGQGTMGVERRQHACYRSSAMEEIAQAIP